MGLVNHPHFRKFFIMAVLTAGLFWSASQLLNNSEAKTEVLDLFETTKSTPAPTNRHEYLTIEANDTLGGLLNDAGISAVISEQIYSASVDVYDLVKIRQGRQLRLSFDLASEQFNELMYPIDSERELYVKLIDGRWQATIEDIKYEIKTKTANGQIESSMYEAALQAGIDERAIIDLANVFQWSVDFALDVRTGDTFSFTYEERYRDGEYIMPGKVLAGKFVNSGHAYYAFYYEDGDGVGGYYDEEGKSVQKMFLKAPVEFKYISSGFTTGRRYVQAFNVSTGHRAIDYAADSGTPIRSVGDGKVSFSGWSGPYGNMVSVRHNGTYSTNYAHMSKRAVMVGEVVKQGDIIGYVGSTGFSTGPHLHYEMVKNGIKINPLQEVLPAEEGLSAEQVSDYLKNISDSKAKID